MIRSKFLKGIVASIMAIMMFMLYVPSVFASAYATNSSEYDLSTVLVSAQTGYPRSISRARYITKDLLKEFQMESIGFLTATEMNEHKYVGFKL